MQSNKSNVCFYNGNRHGRTCSGSRGGGVSFSRNRLVFPSSERSISLTVVNRGMDAKKDVFLVQAAVSKDPTQLRRAPFVVTPPLFRLEANSQNDMRIIPTAANLPTDRESVFYLAATVIPSTSDKGEQEGAQVAFATRTILKLFWRPQGLKMMPQDAPALMRFIYAEKMVVVKNPTPYYQSFSGLAFDGREQDLNNGSSMVAPFGELHIPVSMRVNRVTWQVMNDYGGTTAKKTQPVNAD